MARRNRPPTTWQSVRNLQIALWCTLLVGPIFIFIGVHGNYRDRPSLQSQNVSGTMVESQAWYHHGGKNSYYDVSVTYKYFVGDDRYIGHQVALWNANLRGEGDRARSFVALHRAGTAVDVYYDPQHPERAVLIPGADEFGNRLGIWCGGLVLAVSLYATARSRKVFAKMIADKKALEARTPHNEHLSGLPHAFATYEPACKRKLNCFPDKDCLFEVLGRDGKKLQDWTPNDRVIDSAGREYRLVKGPDKDCYDIEPTGETWQYEKLLEVAESDAQLIGKSPVALHQRVNDAPADKKMAVLMKCIDDLPMGPRWAMAGFALFLILFFFAVVFAAGKIIMWFQK